MTRRRGGLAGIWERVREQAQRGEMLRLWVRGGRFHCCEPKSGWTARGRVPSGLGWRGREHGCHSGQRWGRRRARAEAGSAGGTSSPGRRAEQSASGSVGGARGSPRPCLGAALAGCGARLRGSEEEEVAAAPGRLPAARRGAPRRGPAEAPPRAVPPPPGCAAQTFWRAAGPCGGAALPRHLPVAEPRGERPRSAAGGRAGTGAARGGGGSTVSGAGRLRLPGILQHCRAALRPPPVPGTAALLPGPAGKLGEGAGGGSGAGRGLLLGGVGAAERGKPPRGSESF